MVAAPACNCQCVLVTKFNGEGFSTRNVKGCLTCDTRDAFMRSIKSVLAALYRKRQEYLLGVAKLSKDKNRIKNLFCDRFTQEDIEIARLTGAINRLSMFALLVITRRPVLSTCLCDHHNKGRPVSGTCDLSHCEKSRRENFMLSKEYKKVNWNQLLLRMQRPDRPLFSATKGRISLIHKEPEVVWESLDFKQNRRHSLQEVCKSTLCEDSDRVCRRHSLHQEIFWQSQKVWNISSKEWKLLIDVSGSSEHLLSMKHLRYS